MLTDPILVSRWFQSQFGTSATSWKNRGDSVKL